MLEIVFEVGRNVGGCQQKSCLKPSTSSVKSLSIVSLSGKFFVVFGVLLFLFCSEVVPTENKSVSVNIRHFYTKTRNYDGGYIFNNAERNRAKKVTRNTHRDVRDPVDPNKSSDAFTIVKTPLSPISTMDPCSYDIMDECFAKVPTLPQSGIPSSPAEVEIACKAFDIGMKCMNDWSRTCLNSEAQKKMKASVQGAFEMFMFLCEDPRFRQEFLKHGGCYRKITQLWEGCANEFIENIKKSDRHPEPRKLCCVRIRFLQCVTELSHLQCGKEAADFLQLMAENLVRETMGNANKDNSNSKSGRLQCASYTFRNCSSGDRRSSGATPFPFTMWPSVSISILLLYLILTYIPTFSTASLFL